MPSATVTSKGQITLPIEVRRRLGLKKGDRVEIAYEEGKTVLRPEVPEDDPIARMIGKYPAFKTTEENIRFWREMRGHDELDEKIFAGEDLP